MPRGEHLQLDDRGPVADPGGNVPDSTSDSGAARDEVAPGPEDFAAFYRRELGGLVVLARALAGQAVAEDVAQEAMLVTCRRWDQVQRLASPAGWARGVCMHKAVSVVRRRSVEDRALRRIGRPAPAPDVRDDDEFWALVRTLPERQAQAVALHYALDLSVLEIALTLGCAEGTVKAHLARGRASLAQVLAESEEAGR